MSLIDKTISFSEVFVLSLEVSSEISSKYFHQFLLTNLKLNNYNITSDTKIFYKYIPQTLSYDIYLIETKLKEFYLYWDLFAQYNTNNNLIITDEYFLVFKDGEFLLSKANKNYTKEDIQYYLAYTYKFTPDTTYYFSNKELSALYTQNNLLFNNQFKPLYTNNTFYYYLIYLCIVIISSLYLYNQYFKISSIDQQKKILKNLKNQYHTKLLNQTKISNKSKIFLELNKYLSLYHIKILNFKFNQQLNITLLSKNKQQLYDFIGSYNKKINIQTLKYIDKKNIYLMELEIEY